MEVEIKFEPAGQIGIVAAGTYLYDAAQRMGIEIEAECGRQGECDSCAVKIKEGRELLSEITKAEIENLSESQRNHGKRLSCQARIENQGELVVMTTPKKEAEKPPAEKKVEEFHKEFAELPLEKKVANLLELEAVTFSETVSFVINSPFMVFGKIMDIMAEFGLKLEDNDKKAKRPVEHKAKNNNSDESQNKTKRTKTSVKTKPIENSEGSSA